MLLFLLPAALAVDLDAKLTTPAGEVKAMTFHAVESAAPPPFQVVVNGATMLVTLAVAPEGANWRVAAEIAELDRRGRPHVVSAPQVLVPPGEPASVRQGSRTPIPGTQPVEYHEEAWQLDLVVSPA